MKNHIYTITITLPNMKTDETLIALVIVVALLFFMLYIIWKDDHDDDDDQQSGKATKSSRKQRPSRFNTFLSFVRSIFQKIQSAPRHKLSN